MPCNSVFAHIKQCRKATNAVGALAKGELATLYKSLGTLVQQQLNLLTFQLTSFVAQVDPLKEAVDKTEALWRKSLLPIKKHVSGMHMFAHVVTRS